MLAVALKVAEYVFAEQSVHGAEPDNALYLPAGHAVHTPPEPVVPAEHSTATQADESVLPAGEVLPAGHAVHPLLANTISSVTAIATPFVVLCIDTYWPNATQVISN